MEFSAADEQLLRELTERARTGGLQLTGEGGLLGKLTKMVVEGALEGELGDPAQARRWFEQAAEAGDRDAMNSLGVLLRDSDPVQARRWYEKAAEAGNRDAMYNLALLLSLPFNLRVRAWP